MQGQTTDEAPATGLTRTTHADVRTTGQDFRDRSGPRACPRWARLRRWSAVAATLSFCRIADDRRPGKFFREIREAVSDRGGGVRSGGEAAHKGVRPPARGGAKAKELRS